MAKILVVAAHPDDEVLGCGGTIKRLINEGSEAYLLILSGGVTSRYIEKTEEAINAENERLQESVESNKVIGYKETYYCKFEDNCFDKEPLLNIVKEIEKYINLLKPSIIFTHHHGDLNIDHRTAFAAVQTATRPIFEFCVKEIYCFETFSSTEWSFINTDNFLPNYFVNIEATMQDKLEGMKCYKSELREFPHPRSLESLEINAKRWGTVIGCAYAEAFECIRKII